jgi:hypothetical protein
MQWFYIQRLSDAPSGGTTAQYIGPFYGIPAAMLPLMGAGYYVMIYVNGKWSALLIPWGP